MSRNRISSERVVAVVGLVFLIIAAVTAVLYNGDQNSIIEKVADTSIVIPAVHFICVSLAFVYLITLNPYLMITVLMVESELTILTNYEELGIFFFYATVIIILCSDLVANKVKKIIIAIFILHILTLLLTYTHGIKSTLVAIGYSCFCFAFYFWIYRILKAKFSCFIPKNVTDNKTITGIPAGSVLSLSTYNLNERQVSFVLENLYNKMSYKEISEKYFVSISTVKKEFAEVFKIFNVSNIEELRILLLQYQLQK